MSGVHDLKHTVAGGEDWRRQAAEADASGAMMAELVKQAEMAQALFEVATAAKRAKKQKPGLRMQERDRRKLLLAVQVAKQSTYVDVHKIVHVDSCERMVYCLQEHGWLDEHDQYGWSSLMHAVEAGKDEHVAALLRAGAQKDHRSLQTYGMHPAGSTALDIARRMRDELGIDRAEIIKKLEYEVAKDVIVQGGGKMSVGVLGKLVKKKKEAQRHLAIDSTLGYKTADVEDNRTTTGGGAVNLSDMKRQLRQHKADKEQKESMARGYELATSTVHVGSIGHETHREELDERNLAERFEAYGAVEAAVIRYRNPTPEKPHNSWALVAFESLESVDAMMQGKETAKIPAVDGGGAGDDAVVFTVRRIDPKQAMESTGSFGKIFQECRARVQKAHTAKSAGAAIPDAWKAPSRRSRLASATFTAQVQSDSTAGSGAVLLGELATDVTKAEAEADAAEADAAAAEAALEQAKQFIAQAQQAAAKHAAEEAIAEKLKQKRREAAEHARAKEAQKRREAAEHARAMEAQKRREAAEHARAMEARALEADAEARRAEERKRRAAQAKRVRRQVSNRRDDADSHHPLSPHAQVRGFSFSPRTGSIPKGTSSQSYRRTKPDDIPGLKERSSSGEKGSPASRRTTSGGSAKQAGSTVSSASPKARGSPPPPTPASLRQSGASSTPSSSSSAIAATRRERPQRANRRARTSPGARRREPPAERNRGDRPQQHSYSPDPAPAPAPADATAPAPAGGITTGSKTFPPPLPTKSDPRSPLPKAKAAPKSPSSLNSKAPALPVDHTDSGISSRNTSLSLQPDEHAAPQSPQSASSSWRKSPQSAGSKSKPQVEKQANMEAETFALRKKQREERRRTEARTPPRSSQPAESSSSLRRKSPSADSRSGNAGVEMRQTNTAAERAALRRKQREERRRAEEQAAAAERLAQRKKSRGIIWGSDEDVYSDDGADSRPTLAPSRRTPKTNSRTQRAAGRGTPTQPRERKKPSRKSEFFSDDDSDDADE